MYASFLLFPGLQGKFLPLTTGKLSLKFVFFVDTNCIQHLWCCAIARCSTLQYEGLFDAKTPMVDLSYWQYTIGGAEVIGV